MPTLPTGTVTFLYTDIEGSTRLLQALEEQYADVVAEQRRQVIEGVQSHVGVVVDAVGDNVFAAFARAKDAAAAAVEIQRSIVTYHWPTSGPVRVRMGLHTGEPVRVEAGYVGIDVHRAARIGAAGHGGQILLSQTTRELIADELPLGAHLRDLGQHRLKDLARPLHLYQLSVPDLPSDFPSLKTLSVLPNNLPNLLTTFVGRDREMADIKEKLKRNRLVTLVGIGGGGKTRLALQVAADLLDTYPDGVWLAELTTLTDAALISHTAASILGIREEPGRPILQTLLDYLKPRKLLLILDSCEHLLRETAGLAHTVLHASPNLHILATSREPLHVKGEATYLVSSLRVPDTSAVTDEQLVEFEATQLFIDRAVAVLPTFTPQGEKAETVATICRRLDGIPLAIELAASRIRALSLEQIAERLDDRFALLIGPRVDDPQHQTLQATMDWSYDLLSPHEQVAMRRVAVFHGGFTLDAADRVCGDELLDSAEMLDLVTNLVDKSLIQYQHEKARYDLLETVRQYAWNRLQKAGETQQVRARHLDFFLNLAETADLHLRTAEAAAWLDRIEVEHDNLRAALRWSFERADVASAARIGAAGWWFWLVRGHWSEGLDWLDRILRGIGQAAIRAKILNGAAMLAEYQSDYERAEAFADEALAFCQGLNDNPGVAHALGSLAEIQRARGEYDLVVALAERSIALFHAVGDLWGGAFSRLVLGSTIERDDRSRAVSLLEESLRLFRIVGDPWGTVNALTRLGRTARAQGDYARAAALFTECRVLSEQLRDDRGVAAALAQLGFVMRMRGDYDIARKLVTQSLALFERLGHKSLSTYPQAELAVLELYEGHGETAARLLKEAVDICRQSAGDKLGLAACLNRLGVVRQVEGALEEARALYKESLTYFRDLHDKLGMASCLSDLGKLHLSEGIPEDAARLQRESLVLRSEFGTNHGVAECMERIAAIAAKRSDYTRAARLFGAANSTRENIGVPLPPTERSDRERSIGAVKSELGDTEFTAAWLEGRALKLEQAIDYALEVTS